MYVLIFNLQSGRPTTKGSFKYIPRRYAAPLASCISFHAISLLRLFGLNGGALWCAVRCGLCIYRHYETLSSNLMDDVHEKDVEMHRNLRNLAFASAAAAFFLLYLLLLLIIVVLLNATLSKRLPLLLLNTIMQMMQMAQNALFPSHSIITLHYVFHRSKCFYSCGHQKFWNEVKIQKCIFYIVSTLANQHFFCFLYNVLFANTFSYCAPNGKYRDYVLA